MARRFDVGKNIDEEKNSIFKKWIDSHADISKMWVDSYLKLYKPWIESTGEMFEKGDQLSKETAPQKYREFYNEWIEKYQNSFGKYQIPTLEFNKETFEKLLVSAEETKKIYESWIVELDKYSKVTRKALRGEPDPSKYKEVYDMWIKSFEKILYELPTMPLRPNKKEIFEELKNIKRAEISYAISEIDNQPSLLFSKDMLRELSEYSNEAEEIKKSLNTFLDEFAKVKTGFTLEENTRRFLLNEFVYLIIKMKE